MTLTWVDILEHWDWLEYDFAKELHIDLERSLSRSWRWFTVRVAGLLHEPSSLMHGYARKKVEDG